MHGHCWVPEPLYEYNKESGTGYYYPHVHFAGIQSCNGKEDSMALGELKLIVAVMQNRASQLKVDENEEELPGQYEFQDEKRFPVLMTSFLGPQHGRIFYACMDGEKLIIRQSRLYSFEKKESAPWDFFSRILLSSPEVEKH
ncbi:hypothetical protein ASPWEDRAFT_44534 [Aspergillus wentii DTO 134E9]|uniref:Uncharacterized protein n=1 Tax=Aspergillus wentii DTO 134E9 TaxID=1073089 RepID=A0A1L9RBY0_ASPWE|nr:uncharacterized protein ASPWEDRAFT_44534 [Aspergillus wentii DTO 134E9]OJJ32421.1 hypothetical protein ASPWEDRAFT_44534 [Aspergillus wentii DTO 134E9]